MTTKVRWLLGRLWRLWGNSTYRLAGLVCGQILGRGGCLDSVMLHRSAASGEVEFGRSDLDMVLVVPSCGVSGSDLAALLARVQQLQRLNPAMIHREVYPAGALEAFGRADTVWASIERRTLVRLYGPRHCPESLPVNPDHAVRRLLVWWETFFTQAVAKANPRNLEKACLECWNFFAVAQRLVAKPMLRREQMREHLLASGHPYEGSLREVEGARRFVLDLISRLHADRLPILGRLTQPLIFQTVLAPHCTDRRFLVLPSAQSSLPADYQPGDLLATPELIDLFLQFKNAFMLWSLPPSLAALGIKAPSLEAFRRDAHYTCAAHFLFFPGFGERVALHPGVRLAYVDHVLQCLKQRQLPGAWLQRSALVTDPQAYYREEYESLELERERLASELAALQLG